MEKELTVKFKPIGFVKTEEKNIPRHWSISDAEGEIIIDGKYTEGLRDIKKGQQIIVIFHFHKSPKIDFIIAKYKWELEGIKYAKPLEDIPFPVLPKPYLIAMKLKAGRLKDDNDIIELYSFLTEEEKTKTHELAKLIRRDKKLFYLLRPRKIKREKEDKDLLL